MSNIFSKSILIGLSILVSQANAATVSVEVSGEVTSSSIPGLPVGEPISGRITYDQSVVPAVGTAYLSLPDVLNGTLVILVAGETFDHTDEAGTTFIGFTDGLVTGMDFAVNDFDAYGLTGLNLATTPPAGGIATDQLFIREVGSNTSIAEGMFIFSAPHHAILDVRDVDTPGPDSVLHTGGLTDGVSVYVDRENTQHWDNVPETLEGADYIEGAQENADARDDVGTSLLIEVDVAEGAVLYMFIDERLPVIPFPWMNFANFGADWVDTGLDIFWHRPDHNAVQCLDIWRTVGPLDAGTYNFRQMPEDAAFYGIAATFEAIPDNGVRGCPVITTVTIDVKPDSDPNSINPDAGGFLAVAILTTNIAGDDVADFYALDVDPSTVTFGPADAAIARAAKVKDVDSDGDDDLILHFKISETGIVCGDTEATLTGEMFSGGAIEGTDALITRCK